MPSVMTDIDASAAVVWRLVSDVTRMGEWSPETKSAAWLDTAAAPNVGGNCSGPLSWPDGGFGSFRGASDTPACPEVDPPLRTWPTRVGSR